MKSIIANDKRKNDEEESVLFGIDMRNRLSLSGVDYQGSRYIWYECSALKRMVVMLQGSMDRGKLWVPIARLL